MSAQKAKSVGEQANAYAWLHQRARVAPNLLSQSPPWLRGVFEHSWAPVKALAQQLDCLPRPLWTFLLGCEGGHVWIYDRQSHYAPGPATLQHQAVRNVAYVSIEDLGRENERPLHVIAHLIDHYLGCGGAPEGAWLSGGGGARPRWQEAGARLSRLFPLGYGLDETARANVRDYFAQSLAFYCRDRRRLNVADPQAEKWFRSTLWDKAFWRTTARQEG